MRTGTWMFGLALCVLTSLARGGDETKPPAIGKVRLNLQITGLGPEGCLVEIKPAHKGCEFPVISRRLTSNDRGQLDLEPIDVKTSSADRDCQFAITITEPKQPPKTFRRGVRILNPGTEGILTVQNLPCFLSYQSPPAQIAEGEKAGRPKK